MKKNAVLLYGLFSAFMLIFLTGCSDKIENISDMNGNEVSTRSLSFTDYYWYNGQKIGINKLNNKKYILFDENNENTLKSYSHQKEYTFCYSIYLFRFFAHYTNNNQ